MPPYVLGTAQRTYLQDVTKNYKVIVTNNRHSTVYDMHNTYDAPEQGNGPSRSILSVTC